MKQMPQRKNTLPLRIINPTDEKPSLLRRLFENFNSGGCFLPMVLVGLVVMGVKRLFGSSSKNDDNDCLRFNDTSLLLTLGGIEKEINYDAIQDLQLHYNSENFIEDSDYKKYSKVQFVSNEGKERYYVALSKRQAKKLCKELYQMRIKFREFRNEKRVFLGKSKTYAEIQAITKKYDFYW